MALYGMAYLKNKLANKRNRVKRRYLFYEMKNKVRDFQISTPPELRQWSTTLGWCAKAVDSLADRLQFREFANDEYQINEIFGANNADIFFDSAILSALIASCAFIYISPDASGFPRLQVIDGANATGQIDPITGLLLEGYAVLERDKNHNSSLEAYFLPYSTIYYRNGKLMEPYSNQTGYPLLVPIIYRPDAVRPFGHSRISRASMSYVGSALRTIKRSEITAEFYSFPQKYLLGTDPDMEPLKKWHATMSSLIQITKDEEGERPTAGQFTQASMQPHLDHLKLFASLFAGENGLTMDDLGFATENPSSADAIKASHENLRLMARKAQRNFNSGLLNVGYLAACLRDNFAYSRSNLYKTHSVWEPIFEPDAAMLSGIGDGAIKFNQAVPGYFGKDNLRNLTGIDVSEEPVPLAQDEGGANG